MGCKAMCLCCRLLLPVRLCLSWGTVWEGRGMLRQLQHRMSPPVYYS